MLMKRLMMGVALATLCGFFAACTSATGKSNNNSTAVAQDSAALAEGSENFEDGTAAQPKLPAQVTLSFTGDVLMGTNFPDSSYITRDRGRSLFQDCDSLLKSADLAIGNLEGTCYYGTQGEIRKKSNPNSKTYFIFRMPGDHAQRLVDAGFDAVGIANNHAGDFGQTGRRLTQENLRSVGLQFSGQKGMAEETVIERDGVRYGYLAFASSCANTLDMQDPAYRDQLIKKLRPQCDVLIVTFHGGAEGTSACHVPFKTEFFLGENRGDVHKFAHECIDRGADIVVGHGPHVPRAMELYKGHLIAYSLGNFCAPYRMGTAGATGYAPLLRVTLNTADGSFATGRIHSFKQVKTVGPRLDTTHAAARNIAELTRQDFPDGTLLIAPDGELQAKE